ncbi:MAG: YjjG family noncanonical pyrimidine nucleotidase [Chitinophagales bacterium]|nr:YjjG family noncanonical pyrimidine nucleotidase [Chitinophagales bacterium]MDW8417947.1 YjjG family noncanonical pyrimidine nucleotidase [Chitinophagales bacterium]
MKKYHHIFFDLDNTLWDFDTNSARALQMIFEGEQLHTKGIPSLDDFRRRYKAINDRYWVQYHHGLIPKEEVRIGRFEDTLKAFGIDDRKMAERMAERYVCISPQMTALFPGAAETLQYLSSKYSVHLITNGFADVQRVKIKNCGLAGYFGEIIISEEVGTQKPDPEIFRIALNRVAATPEICLMIGDNMHTDIAGAKAAGMDQALFNPLKKFHREKATYIIHCLEELREFL